MTQKIKVREAKHGTPEILPHLQGESPQEDCVQPLQAKAQKRCVAEVVPTTEFNIGQAIDALEALMEMRDALMSLLERLKR